MIFVGTRFGRSIALALFRDDVDEARPFGGVADIFEHRDQMIHVVAINRPDIIKAKLFEKCAAHRHTARKLVGFLEAEVQLAREFAR